MAERSFAPATGQPYKPQNLYMRMLLTRLNRKKSVTKEDASFIFAIYKGEEQFDKTKQIAIASKTMGDIPLTEISVDFVVINYNPQSRYVFSLRMAIVKEKVIKQIGQYVLQTNTLIDQFLLSETKVFHETISLCDEFQANFQLYIDNSQYGLQRLFRDIKNPRPKKDNQVQSPKVSHQRLAQLRNKIDKEEEPNQQNVQKEHKFKRFSPKRDGSQEKNKKAENFNNKRKQEEQKKAYQEELKLKQRAEKEETKKKGNKQFIPKKQWMIPEAQKFMNQSKANQKQLKRKSSKQSENQTKSVSKPKSQEGKQAKKSRQRPKVQEQSFLEKLPINPKLLLALIAILIIAGPYFIFKGDSPQSQKAAPIFPKSKTSKKEKAKGKSKKGKK